MNRKLIGVLSAVVLAAIGTMLIVAYVRGIEGRAMAAERVVPVLVVTQTIPEGTAAKDITASVEPQQIPAKVLAQGAVADLGELDGLVAAVDLVPGEQLNKARFLSPVAAAEKKGVEVPNGLLEVTVTLEASRVVGGQILPGDTVAVLGSFSDGASDGADDGTGPSTHVLLHKALVTDLRTATAKIDAPEAGEPTAEGAAVPGPQIFVTFALDAPSVERLVHTAEFGSIWLAAEPEDAREAGTRIQRAKTIYEETSSQ